MVAVVGFLTGSFSLEGNLGNDHNTVIWVQFNHIYSRAKLGLSFKTLAFSMGCLWLQTRCPSWTALPAGQCRLHQLWMRTDSVGRISLRITKEFRVHQQVQTHTHHAVDSMTVVQVCSTKTTCTSVNSEWLSGVHTHSVCHVRISMDLSWLPLTYTLALCSNRNDKYRYARVILYSNIGCTFHT